MLNPRLRRLQSDYENIKKNFDNHPRVKIKPSGKPPDRYEITYHIKGIKRVSNGKPVFSNTHTVEIYLPNGYPKTKPKCTPKTPIYHPNFSSDVICIGESAAAEGLADLIVRIGDMIRYADYNPKSVFDSDKARWAERHKSMFPLDDAIASAPEEVLDITLHETEQEIDLVLYDEEEPQLDIVLEPSN